MLYTIRDYPLNIKIIKITKYNHVFIDLWILRKKFINLYNLICFNII